jgi:plasmid stability protein
MKPIRVPDDVYQWLQKRAVRNDRAAAAELRAILRPLAEAEPEPPPRRASRTRPSTKKASRR